MEKAQFEEAPDDLSDDQIEYLLKQADLRLKGRSTTDALITTDSKPNHIQKERGIALPAPPIQTKASVARVNSKGAPGGDGYRNVPTGVRKFEEPVSRKLRKLKEKEASAGSQWYNLPKTDLTPQLKRDLQIIRMRSVLDPHRHYKKDSSRGQVPEFSHVGTMVEGPTEYFSARIPKNERHQTLADSVLAGEKESGRMKRKYNEIQDRKTSGKKAHYRKLMERRYRGRVTK